MIKCLEDAQQQVQLLGLSEHAVHSVEELLALMERAQTLRSTGSTSANLESSRSHQILQLSIKQRVERLVNDGLKHHKGSKFSNRKEIVITEVHYCSPPLRRGSHWFAV